MLTRRRPIPWKAYLYEAGRTAKRYAPELVGAAIGAVVVTVLVLAGVL